MKVFFVLFFSCLNFLLWSQNETIAKYYYDKNDFEKALISYQELIKTQPNNQTYFFKVVECHQALKQFDQAFNLLNKKYEQTKNPLLLIELGHHFQIQKNDIQKKKYFDQAIGSMQINKNYAVSLAVSFEKRSYLEEAIICYEFAQSENPGVYDYQIGLLQGQKGNIDLMIEKLLNVSYINDNLMASVQNQLVFFMRNDPDNNFANQLRKNLLIKVQQTQDVFWNKYLSWLFIQLRQYDKAFIQEKAIYKRDPDNFYNFMFLVQMTYEQEEWRYTKEIIAFILQNTTDPYQWSDANYYLYQIKIKEAKPSDFQLIGSELESLLNQLGRNERTIKLIQLYANFLTFKLHQPQKAIVTLEESLNYRLNPKEIAEIKLDLGDIYLYEEKFNQALLQFAQVESEFSHDPIGHEANLKLAKTNYFKSDFSWALEQFTVLKSAASQLIANDALSYYMLLSDNENFDSINNPLEKFIKADLLLFQNKTQESLRKFKDILETTKDDEIKDDVLFKMAKIYQDMALNDEALKSFETIIKDYQESIYRDEAYYFAALICLNQANESLAKQYLEVILDKHQDSIYFIQARQKLRELIDKQNNS